MKRTRTDGKLENAEVFFWDFWPLVGLLPAGGCKIFDKYSLNLNLSLINVMKINIQFDL